jgi:hypothetical protein
MILVHCRCDKCTGEKGQEGRGSRALCRGTIDHEVRENKAAVRAMERPAALARQPNAGWRIPIRPPPAQPPYGAQQIGDSKALVPPEEWTPLIRWMMDRSNRRLRQVSLFRSTNVRVQAINESRSFSIRMCCSVFVAPVLLDVVQKDLWPSSKLKSSTHLSPCSLRGKMERAEPFGNPDLNLDCDLRRRSTTAGRRSNVW